MKVTVIDGCISCGLCTEEYPDLFSMNEDGVAEAVGPVPPEECPVGVIKAEE